MRSTRRPPGRARRWWYRPVALGGAAALAGIGGLHLAWAAGSTWPMASRAALADTVAGTTEPPGAPACSVVGIGLIGAAVLTAGGGGDRSVARLARTGLAAGLVLRGITGVTGITGALLPWSPSARFVALDRRRYGPLCLVLGAEVALAVRSDVGRRDAQPTQRRRRGGSANLVG